MPAGALLHMQQLTAIIIHYTHDNGTLMKRQLTAGNW